MRQDLFYIPETLFGLPLFGFGLLLVAWCIVAGGILFWVARQYGWRHAETRGQAVTVLIVAAIIALLTPKLMSYEDGRPIGIPIRGYGVFLLIAVVSGVALAIRRAAQRKLPAEWIQSLAIWMFVAGIVGARLFFVIQYWQQFQADTWRQTLWNMLSITEGGLVVYGSLIGATTAFLAFCYRWKLPPLALGDVVAPSLCLGLAIGRVGCLMNGCCYGGICDHPWAITFPEHSPPYLHQMRSGALHGIQIAPRDGQLVIMWVKPHSPAVAAGVEVGQVVSQINGAPVRHMLEAEAALERAGEKLFLQLKDGPTLGWEVDFPTRTLPVHPTQIYSSINALLLMLWLLAIEPFCSRDGILTACTLTIYPITRGILEIIRQDETAFAGSGLTISQNISGLILIGILALWVYIWRQPAGHRWPIRPRLPSDPPTS